MNHHLRHPTKGLCLVAAALLLCTPLIEGEAYSSLNRTFAFHGHRLNAAYHSAAMRWQDSDEHHVSTLPQPVPIPGGINVPPLIHLFAPGPVGQGFQGFDVEPNVITNFSGFTAQGYPTGFNAAQDSNGNLYDVSNDMRVFQGEYVAADGTHHRGTFVFI